MSTSPLYHGFGLVGYRYVRQEFHEGQVIFHIEQPRDRLRCSHCGSIDVWVQGKIERTFHTLPIGSKPVRLRFKVPRVLCFDCRRVRQVKLGPISSTPVASPADGGSRQSIRWGQGPKSSAASAPVSERTNG